MDKVNVMYVGAKPFAVDNVTGSGATWEGRGAVASVKPAQAKRLLSFPDQWWPEGPVPTSEEVAARMAEFFAGNGIPEGVVLPKTLDEMDLDELVAYARQNYGANIRALNEREAREEIEALEEDDQRLRGHGAGVARPTRRPTKPRAKTLPKLDVAKAGKDRLDQYARAHLGVELDQRRKLSELRKDVKALIAKKTVELKG